MGRLPAPTRLGLTFLLFLLVAFGLMLTWGATKGDLLGPQPGIPGVPCGYGQAICYRGQR